MTDTSTRTPPAKAAWPPHLERRRPGRPAEVSPELVALLRDPAQHHRLLHQHLDVPERQDTPRRFARPTVGMAASFLSCGCSSLVAVLLMLLLWG